MEFVITNDLLLEQIIGYLPNEDILKVRLVCRLWYCVVDRILIKNHYTLFGLNVVDNFKPEFLTNLVIIQDEICPPMFALIFGGTRHLNLKRCRTVTIGCDTRLFGHQISTRDMNNFYGGRDFTTELLASLILPRLYCELQVTITDWERGDFLEPLFDYPGEPVKGMIIFYTDRFVLSQSSHLHRFIEEKTELKDNILITGPSKFIQYHNAPNGLETQERSSLLSVTFSGEGVRVAMLSLKLPAKDNLSIQEQLSKFKESLDFEAESNGTDQYTFGLIFIHGNPRIDYRCHLVSLFPKVVFIESTLKNSHDSSQVYGDLVDTIREAPISDPLKSEPARIFQKFPPSSHPDGKISLVIINLKR
ncbi:uncharacterized protein LOC141852477 isoform X2 [Brevipalpus obovatus]|uniref:uncharacterized protein LOC141852477 isoform X2 n=1 Tax=Brevipalpus obovatus TaxID=246614 RepID=UPI003D9FA3CF